MRTWRRAWLVAAAAGLMWSSACSDDTGNKQNNTNQPDAGADMMPDQDNGRCLDVDGDGAQAGPMCATATDCNDNDPAVKPGLDETCGDRKDNNCDGVIDEGCESCTPEKCDGADNDCDGVIDNGCPMCQLEDEACAADGECCYGSCRTDTGVCGPPCRPDGVVCETTADCCNGVCAKAAGAQFGTCISG